MVYISREALLEANKVEIISSREPTKPYQSVSLARSLTLTQSREGVV